MKSSSATKGYCEVERLSDLSLKGGDALAGLYVGDAITG
jgi:hypothetical protein